MRNRQINRLAGGKTRMGTCVAFVLVNILIGTFCTVEAGTRGKNVQAQPGRDEAVSA
jgi:hypothetical protein